MAKWKTRTVKVQLEVVFELNEEDAEDAAMLKMTAADFVSEVREELDAFSLTVVSDETVKV